MKCYNVPKLYVQKQPGSGSVEPNFKDPDPRQNVPEMLCAAPWQYCFREEYGKKFGSDFGSKAISVSIFCIKKLYFC